MEICLKAQTEKTVVFISDKVFTRVLKIGHALRNIGWEVILLHKDEISPQLQHPFSLTARYKSPLEALLLSGQFSPTVYHVFAAWGFDTASWIIRFKPGRVVFDDYDVMAGMVDPQRAEEQYPGFLASEKYCLENADGLCCRSLETQYAKRHLGYRYKGKRIFFPEYVWNTPIETVPIDHKSIVYCGNIHTKDAPPEAFIPYQKLVHSLAQDGMTLHVYPSRKGYERPQNFPNEIVLHATVPPNKLSMEMSRYSAAYHLPFRHFQGKTSSYLDVKPRHSMSGKLFDALDANVPVIIQDQRIQRWLFGRYGFAYLVPENRDPEEPLALDQNKLNEIRERIRKGKSALSLSRHIQRLTHFYESL